MKCSFHISLISVCNKDDVCSCVSFHCYAECGPEMPCDDPMVCTNGLCALACTTDGKLKTTQTFQNKLSSTNTCSVNNITRSQNIYLKMCRILLRSCRLFQGMALGLKMKVHHDDLHTNLNAIKFWCFQIFLNIRLHLILLADQVLADDNLLSEVCVQFLRQLLLDRSQVATYRAFP